MSANPVGDFLDEVLETVVEMMEDICGWLGLDNIFEAWLRIVCADPQQTRDQMITIPYDQELIQQAQELVEHGGLEL